MRRLVLDLDLEGYTEEDAGVLVSAIKTDIRNLPLACIVSELREEVTP